MYTVLITKQAKKDIPFLAKNDIQKLKSILYEVISENPFIGKKLKGSLLGNYSYRLNIRDRIVYSIHEDEKIVYIKRVRTHYGE